MKLKARRNARKLNTTGMETFENYIINDNRGR